MARKATKQVSSIAVGIIRNTGHLIGLANVIGMSPLGHNRKSVTATRMSAFGGTAERCPHWAEYFLGGYFFKYPCVISISRTAAFFSSPVKTD